MSSIETFLPKSQEIQRLYDWIFSKIQPFILGRVLETRSGKGELSSRMIEHGFAIQLNATSETNREHLRQRFKDSPLFKGVHLIDFSLPDLEEKYSLFENKFPTVIVCTDFEEDGRCDTSAINKAKRLISDAGCLIMVSQCLTTFFPGFDQDLELIKRYNRDSIANLLSPFTILKTWYFNYSGACFISVATKP
jgi:hypothetical protein